jgi:hypothetical protein
MAAAAAAEVVAYEKGCDSFQAEEVAEEVMMDRKAVAEEEEVVLLMKGLDGGHRPRLQSHLVVERLEEILEEAQRSKKEEEQIDL